MIMHIAHKTPRSIAALLNLTTIGIENAIAEIRLTLRLLNQQNLITTNAEMSVCQSANLLPIKIDRLLDTVQHYKIISQTLHFGKF